MHDSLDVNLDAARLRPRFSLELQVSADEAVLLLREGLESPELQGTSMAAGRHVDVMVERSERRVWSPRLNVRIEDSPGGSTLRCRFSPRPDMWTGFMFVYFVMVFLVVFGATLGYVQQVSDEAAWGYWGIPIGILIIALIHLAGYVGQRLAASQMRELRKRLETVVFRQFGVDPRRGETS
jgi:hypothetical protein